MELVADGDGVDMRSVNNAEFDGLRKTRGREHAQV